MIISDENSEPILIDNILIPTNLNYFWVLNVEERDFKLQELKTLEEYTCPALILKIFNYAIEVPANWNILIFSPETHQLDIACAYELCKGDFFPFLYNCKNDKLEYQTASVIDYAPKSLVRSPSFNKNEMLCLHVGPMRWICTSPVDTYNKYLKNCTVGDIM
jgi:hypothetical protein